MIGFRQYCRTKNSFTTKLIVFTVLTICFLIFLPLAKGAQSLQFVPKGEVFTSLESVKRLVETEAHVIKSVKSYLPQVNEPVKAGRILKYLQSCEREHKTAVKDIPHYIGNPINAFRLIKRLSHDLNYIEDILKEYTYYTRSNKVRYPMMEDYIGALKAILHLQVVYDLNITDLANGSLISNISRSKQTFVEYVTPMTASDCHELGLAAHEYRERAVAVAWMTEALRKYPCCEDCSFSEMEVVRFIARIHFVRGDFEKTLLWIDESLKLNQTDQQMYESKLFIEYLKKVQAAKDLKKQTKASDVKTPRKNENATESDAADLLCLGETSKTINNKSLLCYYKSGPRPFIRLMNFKVEELHLSPDVLMCHDAVSDKEIEELKLFAKPKMEKATVNEQPQSFNLRIAQVAWFYDYSSKTTRKVSLRMSHFTGRELNKAQKLEICIYGLGGFYGPHNDCRDMMEEPRVCRKYNNSTIVDPVHWRKLTGRSTVLTYLSDVEQGGATIFVKLGVTVFPRKGAAVFWNNLKRSGRVDGRTTHASCPVLRGYKWTITQLM